MEALVFKDQCRSLRLKENRRGHSSLLLEISSVDEKREWHRRKQTLALHRRPSVRQQLAVVNNSHKPNNRPASQLVSGEPVVVVLLEHQMSNRTQLIHVHRNRKLGLQ